jgi:hypothetical protein
MPAETMYALVISMWSGSFLIRADTENSLQAACSGKWSEYLAE